MDTFRSNQERASGTLEEIAVFQGVLLMPRSMGRTDGTTLIPTTALRSGVFSVRGGVTHDDNCVLELAKSVSAVGIIAPIVVREARVGEFEVIAGERRLLAARLLKMAEVPCIVRECSDAEALTLSLIENLQRNNLSPIEKARGLKRLLVDMALTQREVGERIGMPQSAIAHHLRLLRLPVEVQHFIHEGSLSAGHGKILAGVKDPKHVIDLALDCIEKSRSVRDLETSLTCAADRVACEAPCLGAADGGERRTAADATKRAREERELPNGVFVVIKEEGGEHCGGKIEIPYYSQTEKEWVLNTLSRNERRTSARRGPELRQGRRRAAALSTVSGCAPE